MNDAPDDLAPLLEELAWTLEDLRDELGPRRTGPVRGLLRFTERYTIPVAVAVLETNVRLLELTADAIRRADERASERGSGRDRPTRPDAGSPSDVPRGPRGLDALDAALDDLADLLRGVPSDPDARRLLAEARSLRREVRSRLDADTDGSSGRSGGKRSGTRGAPRRGGGRSPAGRARDRTRVPIPVEEESSGRDGEEIDVHLAERDEGTPGGVAIDVDEELESIKRDLDAGESESTEQGRIEARDGDEEQGEDEGQGRDDAQRGNGGREGSAEQDGTAEEDGDGGEDDVSREN